jgi:hypothetical protein
VSALIRWRLATPLIFLSLMCLTATVIGAWAYWADDTAPERALTVFLGIMFAINLGVSISIGTDRDLRDTPWLRVGAVILFFALACGVALVRRSL